MHQTKCVDFQQIAKSERFSSLEGFNNLDVTGEHVLNIEKKKKA
jgi:hypothetical protein